MPPVFRKSPPLELVEQFLKTVGLSNLTDYTHFTKQQIELQKFEQLLPFLEPYYIPCKAGEYLHSGLTRERAITILRQLLKAHSLSLAHSEKSRMGVKSVWYQIKGNSSILANTFNTISEGVLIEFS